MTSTTALATGIARQRILSASYAERLRQSCVCRAVLAAAWLAALGSADQAPAQSDGRLKIATAQVLEKVVGFDGGTRRAVCGGVPRTYGVARRADF